MLPNNWGLVHNHSTCLKILLSCLLHRRKMNSEITSCDEEQQVEIPFRNILPSHCHEDDVAYDLNSSLDNIFALHRSPIHSKDSGVMLASIEHLNSSEFEKASLSPDSPFSGIHLGRNIFEY